MDLYGIPLRLRRRYVAAPGREIVLADSAFLITATSSGNTELILPPMAVMGYTARGFEADGTTTSLDSLELVLRFQNLGLGAMTVVSSLSIAYNTNASTASSNNVLHFAATTSIGVDQKVSGAGISAGTTVLSLTSTAVTLSQNTTGVSSGATITFGYGTPTVNTGVQPDVAIDMQVYDLLSPQPLTLLSKGVDSYVAC